jgi:hypothetical protein
VKQHDADYDSRWNAQSERDVLVRQEQWRKISSLTPGPVDEEMKQWVAERHKLFDQKQQEVIVEFLDLIQSSDEFKRFHEEVAQALRGVW